MGFSFSLSLLCFLLTSHVFGSLYAREPHSRLYYTLYIPTGNSDAAELVARQLEARYEGPVGELQQYHEISTLKPNRRQDLHKRHDDNDFTNVHHALVDQFQQLQQRVQRRDTTASIILQVDSLKPQIRRRRLVKRAPPSYHQRRQDDDDDDEDEEETEDHPTTIQHYLDPISSKDYLMNLTDGFNNLKQALAIDDPGFSRQWHLVNQEQHGHDLNVTGVWSQGITGKNIVVAILDDGLDLDNKDLAANFFAEGSYDFNDRTSLPKPRLPDDNHGTRCAGEIAAVKNGVCGVGMAYDAKVAGIRILSAEITDEDEARALNYKYQENHIFCNSWGPPDSGEVAEAPQGIVLDAIKNGIDKGRNGTGTIYVFASGNGGGNDDNCNFDGYTNSIYTITVGAVDRMGNHPFYSEKCSAQLVVAYSSGSGGNIYTTDVGQNQCTDRHGGTSAAAPLAAGVFALVLSVRPDLTWRDMQYLCVQTAVPLSLDDSDWTLLPSGRMYNHKFGYGKLDAYAIVEAAKSFEKVGPQTYLQLSAARNKRPIPDRSTDTHRGQDLTDMITITQDMVDAAGLARLEHVTATVYIEHERRGDLEILLESPQNVTSQLGAPRKYDVSTAGLIDWTFMTVKHWDEDPVGGWTLRIIDWKNPQFTGSFTNWTLTLWGERVEEVDGEIIHTPTTANTIVVSAHSSNIIPGPSSSFVSQAPIPSSTLFASPEPTSTQVLGSTATPTTILPDSDSGQQKVLDEGMNNATIPSPELKMDGNDDGSSGGTRVFYVMIAGMAVTGLIFMIRRRIKTKDTATYINVPQHQQHHDPFMHEFSMVHQDQLSQRLSSETFDGTLPSYDGAGGGKGR